MSKWKEALLKDKKALAWGSTLNADIIKRRLRELKRIEQKIRSSGAAAKTTPLVWDVFFDLTDASAGKAKYPLKLLMIMDHETLKHVIDEYWSYVYHELFQDTDSIDALHHDPAEVNAVKKRFRELAKQFHPDAGGDEQSFIALMEAYNKLLGK